MIKLVNFFAFLLISSTLEAKGIRFNRNRPTRLRLLHEDQCSSVVKIDCLDKQVRRFSFRERRRSLKICAQLTDEQLLKMLKDVGGYNPLYVAVNKTGAKSFKDPREFKMTKQPIPTRVPDCTKTKKPTTLPSTRPWQRTTNLPFTRRTTPRPWQRTTRGFQKNVPRRWRPGQYFVKDEDPQRSSSLKSLLKNLMDGKRESKQSKRRVRRSSEVKKCWKKGTSVDGSNGNREHMCGECQVVRQLPADVVPRFINEAACGHTLPVQSGIPSEDNTCLADTGLCTQKVLMFPALKRGGYLKDDELSAKKGMDIYVENWVTSTQEIRASCSCEMYKQIADALRASVNG